MLIAISPAKKLDLTKQKRTKKCSTPAFLDDSKILIDCLRKYSEARLAKLMGISPKLAAENHERFAKWSTPFEPSNSKQALLTFQGDVYIGLNAPGYAAADFKFAQDHLRILSGLYGVLKPLDLMQPYRLEMGTKLRSPRGKDLYEFWGTKITEELNRHLKAQKADVLVNLASNEYFKSVKQDSLAARQIVTPVFKDEKNGVYKVIQFFAKKARGLMSSYIIRNRLADVEEIKSFDVEGYRFNRGMSSDTELVFTRKAK